MLNNVLQHFEKIAKIPHCSFDTKQLALHVINHAKNCGYEVSQDSFGNILCKKGNPSICLQSHYDMVCIGSAPKIQLQISENILSAKNSSLGADNGIGVSLMLYMMEKYNDLECLFTNDEEVGLIGAVNLKLNITSPYLLNLDSEDEDEVVIGCAGGVDIFGTISTKKQKISDEYQCFEVEFFGYEGGHSGIDIAKNIKSAIKQLVSFLVQNECQIAYISGGERNNSIPTNAKAVVYCKHDISQQSLHVSVKKIQNDFMVYENSHRILHLLHAFSQGVREYDESLKMPKTSINLSTIKEKDDFLELEFFARAMHQNGIDEMKSQTKSLLNGFGFDVRFENQTMPWTPKEDEFSKKVLNIVTKTIPHASFCAMHAGLECGEILKSQKNIKGVCSIGPNIKNPHSSKESCDLNSVEKIIKILHQLIKEIHVS